MTICRDHSGHAHSASRTRALKGVFQRTLETLKDAVLAGELDKYLKPHLTHDERSLSLARARLLKTT